MKWVQSKIQKSAIKRFNQRIYDGLILFEKKLCLCNKDCFKKIYKYDRYGLWHPVVICKYCGLIQSNPQLTDKEYSRFYASDDYRRLYESENYLGISKSRYQDNNHIFDMVFPLIKKHNFNTILEFGCGGGWNLIPFYKHGYSVTGYDYSSKLIELGRSKGLDLKQGSFPELNSQSDKYDVIILNHVIEHFTDLFNNMASIIKHLNTNGILYIGVPNIDIFAKDQFQNAHVYYFTPRTLNYYMGMCGLEALKFSTSAEKIHMHGVYKHTTIGSIEKKQLSSEYANMKTIILKGKIKSIITFTLERIGMKKTVKKCIDLFKIRKQ